VSTKREPAIDLDHVFFAYDDAFVLQDVTATIEAGEFTALIGASGCGKSTLLSLMAGLRRPTVGELRVFGHPVEGPGHGRAMVFQNFALMPWKSAQANVEAGMRLDGGFDRATIRSRAVEYLDKVGLGGHGSLLPHQLSGGMQQRVGIARALAVEPDILLLDEPLAAIDAQNAELLREELRSLVRGDGRTVVLVTHNLDEALFLADRILLMGANPGRIVSDIAVAREETWTGTPEELILARQAQREELWTHLRDEVTRARDARQLVGAG